MASLDDTPRLLCGRPVDQVWADLDDPPTAHELGCPYCQAARHSLDNLTAATQAMKLAEDADPDLQPSESLTASIVTIARAEVRRGRRIPLDHHTSVHTTTGADLSISEQAIATVVRDLIDTSRYGAEARRCRIDVDLPNPEDSPQRLGKEDAAATRLQVQLSVSLPAGQPLHLAANDLRARIADGVTNKLGLIAIRIDIIVEDLHDLT